MGIEIERKFRVLGRPWQPLAGVRMSQGYLSRDPARTVRIRCAGERAFLTVKGASQGAARAEFEYEIPFADGEQLLTLCEGPILEKVRYELIHAGLTWEIDEFLGDNAGLVMAELELEAEDQLFSPPPWLGREVTGDARYYNSQLSIHPYRAWPEGA